MAKIRRVVLLIVTSREYDRALLRGIARYSRLHGPWTFFREPLFYTKPGTGKTLLSRLKLQEVDGIIMREPMKHDQIISLGLPTVVSPYTKDRIPGPPNVVSDHAAMAEMAAEHLLDRGFQNFAYCGFDDMYFSEARGQFFQKRIEKAGLNVHFYKRPGTKAQRLWENEQIIMAEWLKSLPKPVGLMTCNDDRSQHVIEACTIAGLHVPEDVAIIGIDNDEMICELSNPPLSSLALNAEKAGYEAAAVLDQLMAGKKRVNRTITVSPTHVVARQSTDILAMNDRDVASAVRFIRQHAKEPIQVNNVVEAAAVSRRGLENRFRKILGRSVHDEIKHVRTQLIARMLLETNQSVSQIALALGFSGVENIARYFRQQSGMSLIAYRKKYAHK
jgi:LacI family transcriptional regulator